MTVRFRYLWACLVSVCLLAVACESKLEPTKVVNSEIGIPSNQTLVYWSLQDQLIGSIMLQQFTGQSVRLSWGPFDFHPDWSRDKKWIVYVRSGPVFPERQIWKMRYNGNEKVALTPWDIDCAYAHFSPGGGKIVCAALVDPYEDIRHLVIINADGSGWQQITDNSTLPGFDKISFGESSWAPEGLHLVVEYQTFKADQIQSSIGILELAAGSFQPLSNVSHLSPWSPNWSPIGEKLVFVSGFSGGQIDIFSININGTGLQQLTYDGLSLEPDWSPNGVQIVFSRLDPETQTASIWVMNADGSDQKLVISASQKISLGKPRW